MNYRIEETGRQRFIAKVRAFNNEIINEAGNHDIPDFWGECHKKHLVDEIRNMRPDGKKDLNVEKANELKDLKAEINNLHMLSSGITKFVQNTEKPVLLLIDEVDKASNNQLFLSLIIKQFQIL